MPEDNYKNRIVTALINFSRPNIPKLILLAILSSLFLILQSHVFYLPPLQDCPLSAAHRTLTGLPYAFYTSTRLGDNHFHFLNLLINIGIYYLITCIVVGFFQYGIQAFIDGNKKAKLNFVALASSLFVIGFVSISILAQDLLVQAVRSQKSPAVQALLSIGTTPNSISIKRQYHALHEAVRHNNVALTQLLLKYGARTDKTNYKGQTPLHLAVSRNAIDTTRLLLNSGASTELRDQKGKTPTHYVCSVTMAKLLIQFKAKPNALDAEQKRPSAYSKDSALKRYWASVEKTIKIKQAIKIDTPVIIKKTAPKPTKAKTLNGCTTSLGGTLFAHGKQFPVTTDPEGTITAYSGVHSFAYANCKKTGYYHIVLQTQLPDGTVNKVRYINLYHEGDVKSPLSTAKNQTALVQLKISTGKASLYWYFSNQKLKNLTQAIEKELALEIGRNKLLIKRTAKK